MHNMGPTKYTLTPSLILIYLQKSGSIRYIINTFQSFPNCWLIIWDDYPCCPPTPSMLQYQFRNTP